MLRKILAIALLFAATAAHCPVGCLKCDHFAVDWGCDICDLTRSYYLDSNRMCEQKLQPNCSVPPINPSLSICFECDKDYFVDELTKACAKVPSTMLQDQCVRYSPAIGCLQCSGDFYVAAGKCVAVAQTVPNCYMYLADASCGLCIAGFRKNDAGSKCVEFKKTNNCLTHSDFSCKICKSTYHHAFNIKLLTDINIERVQKGLMEGQQNSLVQNSNTEECIKKLISNCLIYDSYGRCGQCDPLYYPDQLTGNCNLSPESSIYMCKKFANQNECAECEHGYYISGDKCILRTITVPHCETLDPKDQTCIKCHEDYFVSAGQCSVRANSLHIFNCVKVPIDQDICQDCAEGFLKQGDNLACYRPIDNCVEHAIPADNSGTLKCTTCHTDTIPEPASPNTTVCRLRNKPNCRTFVSDHSEDCSVCSVNHYLDSAQCHGYTKFCKVRNPNLDECDSCFSYQYRRLSDKTCHNYNVKNCDNYEPNIDECQTCLAGHYKDTGSKDCVLHHLINCQTGNLTANTCDTCLTGYSTLSPIECTKTDLFGCQTPDASGLCTTCSDGFFKMGSAAGNCEPQQLAGCKVSGMSKFTATCSDCEDGFYLAGGACHLYTVTHCKDGQLNPILDECTTAQCKDGYYLSNTKRCEPILKFGCTLNTTTGLCGSCTDDTYFFFEGGCYKKTILGCQTYAAGNTRSCTACKTGYWLSSTICKPFELSNCTTPDQTNGRCTTCADTFYWDVTAMNCLPQDMIGCKTYTNATSSTCQVALEPYYILNGSDADINHIPYCIQRAASPNGDRCEVCAEGYYANGVSSYTCTAQTPRTNCLKYASNLDKCAQCKNKYQIPSSGGGAGTCVAITKTNCVQSDGIADSCVICENKYKMDGSGGCTQISSTNPVIAHCLGNDKTTDEFCGVCEPGFVLTHVYNYSKQMPQSAETVSGSGEIVNVRKGYGCSNNTNCYPIKNPESKCIYLESGEQTGIDVNGKCQKCRNINKHYLSSKTCTVRTVLNCGVFSENLDSCLACPEGLQYNTSGTVNNNCNETIAPDDSSHCQYTIKGDKGCYLCRKGYVKNVSTAGSPPASQNKCIVAADNDERRCSIVNDSITSGGRCSSCREGFIYDTLNKLCYKDETCIRKKDNSKCFVCNEDYMPIDGNEFLCQPSLIKDECKYYDPNGFYFSLALTVKNYCARCKNPGMIPVNTYDDTKKTVSLKCIPNNIREYSDTVVFIGLNNSDKPKVVTKTLEWMPTMVSTDYSSAISPINAQSCLDFRMPNCKTMDYSLTGVPYFDRCAECIPFHYLSPDNGNGVQCLQGSIFGCRNYVSQYVCSQCDVGFFKNPSNTCSKYNEIEYCVVYNQDTYGCLTCTDGYAVQGGSCVESFEKNCAHFVEGANICLRCNKGFFLQSSQCKPYSVQNCDSYSNSNDRCLLCREDFYLNTTTGECFRNNSRGCKVYSKYDNKCLVCAHNYFLLEDTHICRPFHANNCIQFNPQNGECLLCDSQTFLSTEGNCQIYTLDNCDLFHPHDDLCLKCDFGFFVNYFGTCNRQNLENCSYSDPRSNRCLVCSSGYYLQTNGMCSAYGVKNCSLYNRNRDECLDCLPNFYIATNGSCLPYTISKNCRTLNPYRDECSQCLPGHFLTLNKCVKYTISYCAIHKDDADQCVDCMPGFFMMDNLCHAYNMGNCKQFSLTANACTSCNENQYLEDGLCKVNTALFCSRKSTLSNTCEECPKSFYNYTGLCLPRLESNNCMETQPTMDRCKKCYKTHYLAAGLCISFARKNCKTFNIEKDLCESCEVGKFWMSYNVCEPYTVKNCKEFELGKDSCKTCEEGPHYLKDGKCADSSKVDNCETYSNIEDKCLKCEDKHYFASESECRINPAGIYKCIKYKDQTTCSKCEKGFYVTTNKVGQTYCERSSFLIDVCLDYVGEKKCGECEANYVLINNECLEKTEFSCVTWKDQAECQTCPPNQILKKNASSKMVCEVSNIENCEEAVLNSDDTISCTRCIVGYFPNNNQCALPQAPIEGCARYEKEGVCSECRDRYTLSASKSGCSLDSIFISENCSVAEEHTNPVCKVCEPGFILNANGECNTCGGEGCDVCDPWDTNRCLLCKGGYDYNGIDTCFILNKETTKTTSDNRKNRLYEAVSRLESLFLGLVTILLA